MDVFVLSEFGARIQERHNRLSKISLLNLQVITGLNDLVVGDGRQVSSLENRQQRQIRDRLGPARADRQKTNAGKCCITQTTIWQ